MKYQRGMTLLEVLLAMAILATASVAVLQSVNNNLLSISYVEQKTIASWIAENQLVQLKLENRWPGDSWQKAPIEYAGLTYYWRWKGAETPDPNFRALDVEVAEDEAFKNILVGVRTYVSR